MSSENWKAVPGYPRYDVSTHGRVRSRVHRGRIILKPWLNNMGYLMVTLYNEGGDKDWLVHRLVAIAFLGDHPGLDVCHNDGTATNNYLVNLRWDTRAGNFADKPPHGTSNRGYA